MYKNNDYMSGFREKYSKKMDILRQNVYNFRKKLKMSQYEFAEKLGLIQNYISRLERGEGDFIVELLYAISECYNINPLDLLYNDNPNINNIKQENFEYKELQKSNEKLEAQIDILKDVIREIKVEYNPQK